MLDNAYGPADVTTCNAVFRGFLPRSAEAGMRTAGEALRRAGRSVTGTGSESSALNPNAASREVRRPPSCEEEERKKSRAVMDDALVNS